MKNSLKFLTISAFTIGLLANNAAMAELENYNVAVVDVQKVVASSTQVKTLKAEQKKRLEELSTFVNKAKADLEAQTNPAKKQKLEEKYNKELVAKKEAAEKNYAKKLVDIDKDITAIIQKEAKANSYDLVLTKGMVLYGGKDITNTIIKSVK